MKRQRSLAPQRVFIVSQYPILDAWLQTALDRQPRVEVVGVCRDDLETAYTQTQKLHPDVVLVIAGPEAIRRSALRLVEEFVESLIWIDVTDGLMHIYRREQVDRATLDDLMMAIQIAKETVGEHESLGTGDEPGNPTQGYLTPERRNRNHDCECESSGNYQVNS